MTSTSASARGRTQNRRKGKFTRRPVHPDVLVAERLEKAAQDRRNGPTAMEILAQGLGRSDV